MKIEAASQYYCYSLNRSRDIELQGMGIMNFVIRIPLTRKLSVYMSWPDWGTLKSSFPIFRIHRILQHTSILRLGLIRVEKKLDSTHLDRSIKRRLPKTLVDFSGPAARGLSSMASITAHHVLRPFPVCFSHPKASPFPARYPSQTHQCSRQ